MIMYSRDMEGTSSQYYYTPKAQSILVYGRRKVGKITIFLEYGGADPNDIRYISFF